MATLIGYDEEDEWDGCSANFGRFVNYPHEEEVVLLVRHGPGARVDLQKSRGMNTLERQRERQDRKKADTSSMIAARCFPYQTRLRV
jgi:hypothetical protein